MDKNSLLGLFLIGIVIIGYSWFTQPSADELASKAAQTDSLRTAQTEASVRAPVVNPSESDAAVAPSEMDSAQLAAFESSKLTQYGIFSAASLESDESAEYVLESDLLKIIFQQKGGQMKSLELKTFKTSKQEPLLLFDEKSDMNFRFSTTEGKLINTSDLTFTPANTPQAGDTSMVMRLRTTDPDKYLDLIYSVKKGSYEVAFEMDFHGLQQIVDTKRDDLSMIWNMTAFLKEKSMDRDRERSSVFFRYKGEDRDYLSETKDDEEELEARTNWVAFKQNFFSAVAISEEGFLKDNSGIEIRLPAEGDSVITKEYLAELTLPIEYKPEPHVGFKFYMGPNDYSILRTYENEMDRIIDLGWGIFGWMNKWLVIPIFNFLHGFISSFGIIILILTIIIKMMLFPLTYKNYLSSAKMRALKPQIDELTKKFENEKDPMKKQQATMGLYRKSGVNPMAGCLPMVVQMPILYAMFRFFPASIELRQQPFLWADDLSSFDSIASLPFSIPFYGDHVSLFTLLMAVSTIFYTQMNSSQMPANQPGMPNMKTLMYLFPVMMLFFFNSFASGLSYYYLLANLLSIGQMIVIKKYIIDDDKLLATIQENQKKPIKKSNFQKRLEDAAKQRGYKSK
jgi:YidC/Oxa1 family membrane protein insertase